MALNVSNHNGMLSTDDFLDLKSIPRLLYPTNQTNSYKIFIRIAPIIMIVSDYIPVEQEKLLRYSSHEDFIRKCIRERIVPNVFTLKWNIQMGADSELQRKCEKVKLDASLKLMEITAEACRRNIQNLGKHEKYVDYSEISLRDNGPLSQKKT